MTGHFGVDSRTKPIHSVVVTAANAADGTVVCQLLHGGATGVGAEFRVYPPAAAARE